MIGNTFTNQEEPLVDQDMERINGDISNQDRDGNNGRSISSIADEIINLDISAYSPGSDELGTRKQLYKCEECEASYKTTNGLLYHTRSKHECIMYSCQQCSYKATQSGHLKRHQQSVHEGVSYSCNECEYKAKQQRNLKSHQQSVHEGVSYSCNQC